MKPGILTKITLLIGIGLFSFELGLASPKAEPWTAPASADTLENPLKETPKAWKNGAAIYNSACVVCHGNRGYGDGIAGSALNPRPADLTAEKVRAQSDGAIFWKLTEGKPPMASYKAIYTDEQRWQLVEYIRKLNDE